MVRYATIVVLIALAACSFAQREKSRRLSGCCTAVSSARIPYTITGYRHQKAMGLCVEAIVFQTNKGRFCSNPKALWVAKKIKDF
nr:C-C motif chemokine 24-like [Paramormyrops kingsleyae]XP_023656459.1 C-C motif chemokine 24-like [Paramormyrops kingsleyae]XP_023656460.1 C-C motif chemokine 24-like [Paramormyrops kingsleyae]